MKREYTKTRNQQICFRSTEELKNSLEEQASNLNMKKTDLCEVGVSIAVALAKKGQLHRFLQSEILAN